MDCHMPVMDGYEATRCIREGEQKDGTHIPIVALTANSSDTDREKCIASGMDDFTSKPVVSAELLRVLKQYLSPSKQTAGLLTSDYVP